MPQCPASKAAGDADRIVRILRAAVRCQPLLYVAALLGFGIWWTWSDAMQSSRLAAAEAEDAKRAAISAKYEAKDAKSATERVERSLDRQMGRIQDTLDRLTAYLMQHKADKP